MGWSYHNKPPMGWPLDWSSPLSKGLVSLWLMNESSGNRVQDLSGNGNTGSYTGTPEWNAGFYGPQVRCDDDQYITFANKATDYITDKMTVVWIGTPAQLTADRRYFFVGQYTTPNLNDYGWGLYINNSPYPPSFYIRTAGGVVTSDATSSLVVGQKVVIVGVYDGANLSIYVNGVLEDSGDAQTGNVDNNFPLVLGGAWWDGKYADIKTDVFSIYNRALTTGEIAQLCREQFGMFKDPDEIPVLDQYYTVAVGNAGIMTPNTGFWGPTF